MHAYHDWAVEGLSITRDGECNYTFRIVVSKDSISRQITFRNIDWLAATFLGVIANEKSIYDITDEEKDIPANVQANKLRGYRIEFSSGSVIRLWAPPPVDEGLND